MTEPVMIAIAVILCGAVSFLVSWSVMKYNDTWDRKFFSLVIKYQRDRINELELKMMEMEVNMNNRIDELEAEMKRNMYDLYQKGDQQ